MHVFKTIAWGQITIPKSCPTREKVLVKPFAYNVP